MSIIKFLTSKVLLKQVALALVAIVVLCFIMLKWLNITTNHGTFETVPDLKGKSVDVAKIELEDNELVMEIQDSANYNPNYPKYSVIDQDPISGKQVKEHRKIYVTVNPSGYRKIRVPYLVGKTYRQAKPTLESLGFKIGKKTYVDYLGEDEVVKMTYKGKAIKKGDKLPKTATIDVVLGNGKRS
jgi:beta-lactam-binding protein with PASTA domain